VEKFGFGEHLFHIILRSPPGCAASNFLSACTIHDDVALVRSILMLQISLHRHYLSILGVDDGLNQFVEKRLVTKGFVAFIQFVTSSFQEHFCHVDSILMMRNHLPHECYDGVTFMFHSHVVVHCAINGLYAVFKDRGFSAQSRFAPL